MTDQGLIDDGGDGSDGPGRLSVDDIRYLRRLGDAWHAAPNPSEQNELIAHLLRIARRHRAEGVGWEHIAVAIGVARHELQGWQRAATDPKPRPMTPERPRPPPTVTGGAADARPRLPITANQHIAATMNAESRINAESRQTSAANATDIGIGPLAATGRHARRVLFTSGDARPGRNDFGLEAAAVRQCMYPTIDVREIACLALHELARLLDEHRPAVLHIAAHSAFGGIMLSLDGEVLSVEMSAFQNTVLGSRPPPRLVVLNLCASTGVAAALSAGTTSIAAIGWPGLVDDDQARKFARLLYPALTANATIADALTNTCPTLGELWPGLDLPRGFGAIHDPLFLRARS